MQSPSMAQLQFEPQSDSRQLIQKGVLPQLGLFSSPDIVTGTKMTAKDLESAGFVASNLGLKMAPRKRRLNFRMG